MPEQENAKWKREFSAGGVVYKKENGSIFILLIMPFGHNWGPPEGYWTFPKGHNDEGEDMQTAAVREVREEGGVVAEIEVKLGTSKIFMNHNKVLKFVDYYLMKYVSGDPKDHDKEVAESKWIKLAEVESQLKFSHDKEIFEKAKVQINARLSD